MGWLVQAIGTSTISTVSRSIVGGPEQRALRKAVDTAIRAFVADLEPADSDHLVEVLAQLYSTPPELPFSTGESVYETLVEGLREPLRPLADPLVTETGESYLEHIGVDPESFLRRFPEAVVNAIRRVATEHAALAPLAAQLNADVLLAEVRALRNDGENSGGHGAHGTERRLLALARALEAVPALADEAGRGSLIAQLRPDIRGMIRHDPRARLLLLNLARTCAAYPGGVAELIDILSHVEGDSLPMRRLRRAALPWLGAAGEEHGHP